MISRFLALGMLSVALSGQAMAAQIPAQPKLPTDFLANQRLALPPTLHAPGMYVYSSPMGFISQGGTHRKLSANEAFTVTECTDQGYQPICHLSTGEYAMASDLLARAPQVVATLLPDFAARSIKQ